MKSLIGLFSVLILDLIVTSVCAATPIVTLTPENTVGFTSEVTQDSISSLIINIEKLPAKNVYVYIISPGGDVTAGEKFLEYAQTTDKHLICIADVAISMAYHMLEGCHERLVVPSTLLMEHQAVASLQGNVHQMQGLLDSIIKDITRVETDTAKRLGISLDKYRELTMNEWWSVADDAIKYNEADKIVLAKCSSQLLKIETKDTMAVNFGPLTGSVPIIKNGCPFITPKIDNTKSDGLPQDLLKEAMKLLNRDRFVEQYLKQK
jgi:ATP-dependent Clp protease, protease subunit